MMKMIKIEPKIIFGVTSNTFCPVIQFPHLRTFFTDVHTVIRTYVTPQEHTMQLVCTVHTYMSTCIRTYVHCLQSLLKEVHSKLIPLLSKKNPCTNVATLRVLANLSLNTALGEAMFSAQNIEPTFGVVFNVFYRQNNNTSAVSNAVDLLVDMLKCERIQKAFVHYKHLKVCVQSTLVLLVFSSGTTLAKLCELFQCFLGISELHQMVMNLFFTRVSDVSGNAPPEVLSQLDTSGARLSSLVVTLLLGLVDRDAQFCPQSRSVAMKVLQLLRDIFEVRTYTFIRICMYVCICMYKQYVCMYLYVQTVCMYVSVLTCVYLRTYVPTVYLNHCMFALYANVL